MGKSATASKAQKSAMKVVQKQKSTRLRAGLGTSLEQLVKEAGGRKDIDFTTATKTRKNVMLDVSVTERAGYPVVRAKGSADPAKWVTKNGKKVIIDFRRHAWLPETWAQGVKATNATAHSTGTAGGTYTVIMSPSGETFYHKHAAEEHAGYEFTLEGGRSGQIRFAKARAKEAVQVARAEIKDAKPGDGPIGLDSDKSFFALLTPRERACLAPVKSFHFCVVSARRAKSIEGIRDIFAVQTQLKEAGVEPTWYVDADSLKDYRDLGLKAVVGGKLTPARNKALHDARRLGKVCVQLSDDISAWEYRYGKTAAVRDDDAMNKAHKAARRLIISPVAAARFILAKMRSSPLERKPKLGGVYMLGSCSRVFYGDNAFQTKNFILGDFFVADVGSKVDFDNSMTLKEDYDFTCQHIRTHGSVLRCSHLTLSVKHYSNVGGACANRDAKGTEEQKNIQILKSKWPRAFRKHPKRKNEVVMSWPADDDAEGSKDKKKSKGTLEGGKGAKQKKKEASKAKKVVRK